MRNLVLIQSGVDPATLSTARVNLSTPIRNVESVRLLNVAIPNCVYNIEYKKSFLTFELYTGEIISIDLLSGRYSLSEYMLELGKQLNTHPICGAFRWVVSYDHIRYKVVISNIITKWRFSQLNIESRFLIGFQIPSELFLLTHIAEASPVFNSNKYIGIDIKELPGGVEICSQNVQYSFVIPFPTASDTITYLGRDALQSQILKFNHRGRHTNIIDISNANGNQGEAGDSKSLVDHARDCFI